MSTSKKYKIYTHRSQSAPPFIQIPESDLWEANNKLSKSGFTLYLYLAKNSENYLSEFGVRDLENQGIINHSSAIRGLKELIEKGYINGEHFYVESREKRLKKIEIQKEINNIMRDN